MKSILDLDVLILEFVKNKIPVTILNKEEVFGSSNELDLIDDIVLDLNTQMKSEAILFIKAGELYLKGRYDVYKYDDNSIKVFDWICGIVADFYNYRGFGSDYWIDLLTKKGY